MIKIPSLGLQKEYKNEKTGYQMSKFWIFLCKTHLNHLYY